MDHRVLTTNRGDVHYWVGGPTRSEARATLVFTHGATMDHGMFDAQVSRFAGEYRVISWDVPGHGASRPYSGFSLGRAATDLVALLDACGVETVHMIGQSMGGYIAQVFAVEYPTRVLSLCAVDSSPLKSDYYSRLDRWLLSVTPALLKLYPYRTLVETIAKQVSDSEEGRRYAAGVLSKLTKSEIADIMSTVYRGLLDYAERHVAFSCPVLLVVGENDRSGKVASYCRRWSEEEGHELVFLPNAAHNSNVDNPAAFNETLQTFLQSSGQTEPGRDR